MSEENPYASQVKEDKKNLIHGQIVYVAISGKKEIVAVSSNPNRSYNNAIIRG